MKKTQFNYGIYLAVLILLYGLLVGCQMKTQNEVTEDQSSKLPTDSANSIVEESQETGSESQTDNIQTDESVVAETTETSVVEFTVEPGACLIEILDDLAEAGWGETAATLLLKLEQEDAAAYQYWSQVENIEERAFQAEGYIAPGVYEWEQTASTEEVLKKLLSSWDEIFTDEMVDMAKKQGYTVDEVLIMASIVEWESSYDPYNIVKPKVAAVIRNRIESDTALQMDVTIFYLQESLEPYRDPQQYESFYDTYIRSTLPAGPIGSPSIDSIQAVLKPADTNDLFFVYDEDGNYYFAEDYEQHLINCDLAGIY